MLIQDIVRKNSSGDDPDFCPRDLNYYNKMNLEKIISPRDLDDNRSQRNANQVKDNSVIEEEKEFSEKHIPNIDLPKITRLSNASEKVSDIEVHPSPTPRDKKATIIKQKTFLDTLTGANAFNDIIASRGGPESKSFNRTPKTDSWEFAIFEMAKKRYHLFKNQKKGNVIASIEVAMQFINLIINDLSLKAKSICFNMIYILHSKIACFSP